MRSLILPLTASLAALFSSTTAFGQKAPAAKPAPLMKILSRFTTLACRPWAAVRLKNGNTIVGSRETEGKTPQLVEVTPDKKVVWVLQDWANFGPATAVQILDEPGIPEKPGDSQH